MEFPDPVSNHHHHPHLSYFAEERRLNVYQHQQQPPLLSQPYSSSSFTYLPNTNPNPNPNFVGFENHLPISSTSAAAPGVLRTPEVGPYIHDPYASPLAYDRSQLQLYGVVGAENTAADLETKRRKVLAGGAPPESVRVCTICNVVCNSEKVFARHLAGEKHALKAFGLPSNSLKPKNHGRMKAKTTAKRGSNGLISFVQSSYCDVCKLAFNSQQVLANHKLGRKHTKNLQKLLESLNPKPANAPKTVNPTINPSASENKAANDQPKQNAATKENLENKTQKVLHGGAAVDTVRVCTLCNVVCNSEVVYNSHIAGKKHIAKGTNPSASESSTVNDQPKKNAATKEDLETKKQKVLNGGAAADAVRVCTLCNVVCNSDAVYNIHIAGKKHIARMSEHQQVDR